MSLRPERRDELVEALVQLEQLELLPPCASSLSDACGVALAGPS